jgi:hypothetical protein
MYEGIYINAMTTLETQALSVGTDYVIPINTTRGRRIHIEWLRFNTSGTASTVTFMAPLKYTTVNGDAAGGQADVIVADATGIDANDHVAFLLESTGQWFFSTVQSVSDSTLTLNDNLPAEGLKDKAQARGFGEATDSGHIANRTTAASGDTELTATATLALSTGIGEAIIIYATNQTNAVKFDGGLVLYSALPRG